MAMRIAFRAPPRPLASINGCSQFTARRLSISPHTSQEHETISRESFEVFGGRTGPKHSKRSFNRPNTARRRNDRDGYKPPMRPKSQPRLEQNPVEIKVGEHYHKFSPLLLRDLCQCSQCVDPSTRQKHFATADIPPEIHHRKVLWDDEKVEINWYDDIPGLDASHTTTIPIRTLENIVFNGRPVQPKKPLSRSLWNAQQFAEETHDFDYQSYMNDDNILFTALKQLETHGLMFITNVPEDEKSVETIAERIGPLKTTFYGRTWDVRSVPEAKNVAYTSQNLGFHMDLMYMKQPPHLQLLHCIRSSAKGGASLFSDSFKAVQELAETDMPTFTALSRLPATYHYDHVDHYYRQRRPVIEQSKMQIGPTNMRDFSDFLGMRSKEHNPSRFQDLTAMDFVEHVAWSPPFQGPFSLASEDTKRYGAPEEFLSSAIKSWHTAAQKFNKLIHRPDMIYERLMKPGECVIFDNRRVLHARRAFEVGDTGTERWLRGAYIDKDPYMSKLKIMTEQQGEVGTVEGTEEMQLGEAWVQQSAAA